MNKLTIIAAFLFLSVYTNAQPPNVAADKGATFGEIITPDNAVSVEQAIANVEKKEGEKTAVKIKGTVTSVCEDMGCWLTIKSPKGDMTIKMKDHAFFVPLVLKGKEIILDGIAEEKITSVSQLRHYAADAGKSKEEINAITEAKKEITISAKGILVL